MAPEQVCAVVQARMGSARLPGKVLLPFAGSTVLGHLLERLRHVRHPLDVCVATSTLPEDDAIVAAGEAAGVDVFRGPSEDVLARFVACVGSRPRPPELVLRICADRPLLCPTLVDELLEAYEELDRPDYLSNNLPPSYPDGLDLELVRRDALEQAGRESGDQYEREHVTPFVYHRPDRFWLASITCPFGNYSHVRLTLDTPEDYEKLTELQVRLPSRYDYRDTLTVAELAG
jgi:spore coat polysaccharide biosynthesis protein SpsF (cytidylyltransferase family)